MPKKRKKRFDPNPELKGLPKTKKELDEMFAKDAYCQSMAQDIDTLRKRIDDAQVMLLEKQNELIDTQTKLKLLEERVRMFRSDRDAAVHTLKMVLTDQRLTEFVHARG